MSVTGGERNNVSGTRQTLAYNGTRTVQEAPQEQKTTSFRSVTMLPTERGSGAATGATGEAGPDDSATERLPLHRKAASGTDDL